MKLSLHTDGFTLVETLIYLSVMVLLVGALVTSFLSLDTVFVRNATERALIQGAHVSLDRMTRAILSADTVHTGQSTLGTSMGALALVEAATTTRFYVTGDTLMMSVNGSDLGPLTGDGVSVEDVVFHHYVGSTTEMVRVILTLSAVGKASSSTRTFYTSAVLRGSYE